MQVKTTVRYHSKPIRIAIIKKDDNKYWLRSEEIRTLILVGMQNDIYTFENGLAVLEMLNIGLPYDLAILLLLYIQEKEKYIFTQKIGNKYS